ncbi:MAG: hypothetical protein WC915_06485 [archaeon]
MFLKKERMILLILFGIIFIFSPFITAETITELEIPNSPPHLIMDIPNQSWQENRSNLNAFDLDDYFEDPEGDILTYYNSSIDDIYVYIDPTTNEVSFFPRAGFSGVKNVTFYASDSIYDSLSNKVSLLVGQDNLPPQWSFPIVSKATIYQNDILTFYTNWTDDRGLASYILSINQGVGWENYSSIAFSGIQNTSLYEIQVRAPALNTVYWKFYAFDSSGNVNITSVQSFVVSAQQIPSEESGDSENSETGIKKLTKKLEVLQIRKVENFQLNEEEFKVTLKQGSFKTKVLRLTNTGIDDILITLYAQKISNFTVFSETNISISPGKSKEITIDFNAPERTIPGQYFGYIKVESNEVKKSIPVVLDIQGIDLEFDLILNLSEEFATVKPGESVKVNITITNLKDFKQTNASMYYAIKDYNGIVYNFFEEDISFFSTLLLERELVVPEITPEGNYLLYVRVSDDKNIAIDSVVFAVGNRFNLFSFFKLGSIFIFILASAILLAAFMVKYNRDKKKSELLELYVMLNKLKNLIKQGKEEEALKLFIKIKEIYHEPVPKEVFDDKERLKKEISELCTTFAKDSKDKIIPPAQTDKKELKENLQKEKNDKK